MISIALLFHPSYTYPSSSNLPSYFSNSRYSRVLLPCSRNILSNSVGVDKCSCSKYLWLI